MIESDHRIYGDETAQEKILDQMSRGKAVDEEVVNLPVTEFGRVKAPAGTWGSCIRIIDPTQNSTVAVIPLDNNEAAFSIAVVPFSARNGELFLVVGTAANTRVSLMIRVKR